MFLAEKTIKNYVSSILAKLGLERRTQAAVLATKLLQPALTAAHPTPQRSGTRHTNDVPRGCPGGELERAAQGGARGVARCAARSR